GGSGEVCEIRSTMIALPETRGRSLGRMNVPARVLTPRLLKHANVRLSRPPTAAQFVHLRLIPDCAKADDATKSMAATMPEASRVRFISDFLRSVETGVRFGWHGRSSTPVPPWTHTQPTALGAGLMATE